MIEGRSNRRTLFRSIVLAQSLIHAIDDVFHYLAQGGVSVFFFQAEDGIRDILKFFCHSICLRVSYKPVFKLLFASGSPNQQSLPFSVLCWFGEPFRNCFFVGQVAPTVSGK